jgi:hypothetical protein
LCLFAAKKSRAEGWLQNEPLAAARLFRAVAKKTADHADFAAEAPVCGASAAGVRVIRG